MIYSVLHILSVLHLQSKVWLSSQVLVTAKLSHDLVHALQASCCFKYFSYNNNAVWADQHTKTSKEESSSEHFCTRSVTLINSLPVLFIASHWNAYAQLNR